jgi:hypothetical protein
MAVVPMKRRRPPNSFETPDLFSKERTHSPTRSAFGLGLRTGKRVDRHRRLLCVSLRNENQSRQEAVIPMVRSR